MKKERKQVEIASFPVESAKGVRETLTELGLMVREQYVEETWSDWALSSSSYWLDGKQVQANEDGTFTIAGEVFTRTST